MTDSMDLLALAAVASAVRRELGRLEEDPLYRLRFFQGQAIEIPMPLRPMTDDVNDPDLDGQMWLKLQLVPVSNVVDSAVRRLER